MRKRIIPLHYDWRPGLRGMMVFGSTALFGVGFYNAWLYHTNERAGWWVLLLAGPALLLGLAANVGLAIWLTKPPTAKL